MRRRKKDDAGSLDSLLDTMTNVVGILVILLAVTQLGVSDAVKRIVRAQETAEAMPEITPDALSEAEREAEKLRDMIAKLKERNPDLDDRIQSEEISLDKLRKVMADLKAELDKPLDPAGSMEKLRKEIADRTKRSQELGKDVLAAQEQLARLQAMLEKTPERFDPPPRVIHLPDPRSAPKGAKPMYFLCRGGRIMPLEQDRLLLVGETNLRRAGAKLDNKTEIDCAKLVNYFKAKNLGNEYFNLRLRIFNHQLHLEFARKRPDIGETTEQLRGKTSQFQRAIRRTNPKLNYVRYIVWNDSFDTYLEARGISDSQGLAAGWQMQDYKDEYRIWFGNRVKCEGTPPPPPPKPKPKPDPNKPAPPPRKPLPTDQID